MPLYHFHIDDGVDRPDGEGTELPGFAAARAESLQLAGEIVRNAGLRGSLGDRWRITVTDENGTTLILIDVTMAVSVPAVKL